MKYYPVTNCQIFENNVKSSMIFHGIGSNTVKNPISGIKHQGQTSHSHAGFL